MFKNVGFFLEVSITFIFLAIVTFLQEGNLYNLSNYCISNAVLLVPQRKDSVNHTAHKNQPQGCPYPCSSVDRWRDNGAEWLSLAV